MRHFSAITLAVFVVSAVGMALAADDTLEASLLANLQKISNKIDIIGHFQDDEDVARAKAAIAANPGKAFDILSDALRQYTYDTDIQMWQACLWGLGETKDARAVDIVIAALEKCRDRTGYAALAKIGTEPALKYLMHEAETMPPAEKYPITETPGMPHEAVVVPDLKLIAMDLLAGKKYLPVTTLTHEMFERAMPGPEMQQIQLQVIFGKLGDAGIPFLLQKLADPNKNTRANAVFLLGMWLCAPEAGKALKERYPLEPDPEIRNFIVFSLERTIPPTEVEAFLNQIKETEKDQTVASTISEAVNLIQEFKEETAEEEAPAKPDKEAFLKAVQAYRDNRNLETETLAKASAVEFEPELKALREEMLGVEPMDDSIMCYYEITFIIVQNRMRSQVQNPSQAQ